LIDFSFNNTSYTQYARSRYTTTAANRSLIYETDSNNGDPLSWTGSSPIADAFARVPNLRLTFEGTPTAMSPTTASAFVNGVWSGNVTVNQTSSLLSLRADDNAGHSGQSPTFNVLPPLPVISSPLSAIACIGQPFSYQIVASNSPTTLHASNLPSGLSESPGSTGLISGTPTEAGSYSIGLSASNAGGAHFQFLTLVVMADADGDGIGDDWEITNGLNPASAADATLDKDGDGQSNRAEWLAGTAANDPSLSLRVLDQQVVGSDVVITWSAVAGKRYRIVAGTTLGSTGSGGWTDLSPTPVVATNTTVTFTHVGGKSGATARFYRVEIAP
jgi:hypothetical protein